MKKILVLLVFLVSVVYSQNTKNYIDSLQTIDPELRKYFPRWKVCEPDLQYQIYQAFQLLGFSQDQLDIQSIEVLASPKPYDEEKYDILLLTCGNSSLNSKELDRELSNLVKFLDGSKYYVRYDKGNDEIRKMVKEYEKSKFRSYCYVEIPPETPVRADQGAAIRDYFAPTNKRQALTMSLFDQTLKIGATDFWIQNKTGNDQIGYPYYNAGESKVILKRPLYVNNDPATNKNTPYLINAYLGGTYRITTGLSNNNGMFSWLPERSLNTDPGGKLIFGMDVHMPFHPEAGIHVNIEAPINTTDESGIDLEKFGQTMLRPSVDFRRNDIRNGDPTYVATGVLPILQTTGQVTAFYNLWLNKRKAENYFRFDLGISYAEIREYMYYTENVDLTGDDVPELVYDKMTTNAEGLNLYHPDEFADWLFAKVEYRNQAVFPFSLSLQYSNQIMLARAYMPLFGDWLLLEAKYATPLRDAYEFEVENFFIISPVIRIAID